MQLNTNQIMTMTEANQNFSKVVRVADKSGAAVIFKNNKPKYLIIDLNQSPIIELSDNEKIDVVSKRVLEKYKEAFLELAK